ncbi:MAG: ABC transporter permease [Desulfobulbaceae bacterium]|nr:ABC transporter permease [Desulfobulbaceae bacterium]
MESRAASNRLGPVFWVSITWLTLLVIGAVTIDLWAIQDPDKMDWDNLNASPGAVTEIAVDKPSGETSQSPYTYWLGTDSMGRDILSRSIYGARISLSIGLIAPLIGIFTGGFLGCLAGFYRGYLDSLIVAGMDIILAFPGLLLLLAVSFYVGASLQNLILSLGFLSIPAFCRVARARTLALSNLEFVQAAKLTGAGDLAILMREIIPNVVIPVTVYGLLVVAFMIMAEGSLSFLGLGVSAPTPSWGRMIAEGRDVLDESPYVSMIPAAIMILTVISFNFIGDSLRNYFDHGRRQI